MASSLAMAYHLSHRYHQPEKAVARELTSLVNHLQIENAKFMLRIRFDWPIHNHLSENR